MAAWILTDDERSRLAWELRAKKRFELGEVELFSRSNGGCLILKASHVFVARSPYL
jgi:hypothetical protein